MLHGAIKVTELQEEAIAVRVVAPSETHVKAYVMAVGRDSSKLQSLPSEEEENPTHPMITLTQVGKCHVISKQSLVNLANHELHQLVEDLHQEITIHELNAPPAALHQ